MQAVDVIRSLADRVAPVTISRIGRVAMTTADDVIEMPNTVVLVTGQSTYVLLRYSPSGLTCASGSDLTALWPADDREPGEWLEVAAMPEGPPPSAFPSAVTAVSAYIGTGTYEDVLGLTLRLSSGPELVLSTGEDQLDVVPKDALLVSVQKVAEWAKMRVEQVTFVPGH
jgi:hypothetical protein